MFSHILQLKRLRHFTGYFEPFLQSLNHLPYNHFHLPTRDQNWNLGKATFHGSCELIKKNCREKYPATKQIQCTHNDTLPSIKIYLGEDGSPPRLV